MKYIARAMGVKLPFLPLHGSDEAKLFSRLVLEMPTGFNDIIMALEWIKHVNGTSIFPKIPVYLRLHHERWERNQRVKDAVRKTKTDQQLLDLVNKSNMLLSSGALQVPGVEAAASIVDDNFDDEVQNSDEHDGIPDIGDGAISQQISPGQMWQAQLRCHSLIQPHFLAIRPSCQQLGPPVVGGLLIGLYNEMGAGRTKRKRGQRGEDSKPRKVRTCIRCKTNKGERAADCNGRHGHLGGQKACQFFDENGAPVDP
jgi:hypothetical protein